MGAASAKYPFEQVLVVGGTGQTGHRVLELFLERGVARVVATSRAEKDGAPAGPLAATIEHDARAWRGRVRWAALDLEQPEDVFARQLDALGAALEPAKRTALVVAAAFTNVDGCENDPAFCERVNVINTVAVMKWARERFSARVAFYSTDYVFDGENGPYGEDSPRSPVNTYGRSKAKVEEWLERNAPEALILRTTGVYDDLPGSKNFLMQMLSMWADGKTARVPCDQLSNPVWARELARATVELLERGCSGIFHVGGGEQLARIDFARAIARVFGYRLELVTAVETSALAQKARRPLKGGLVCEKVRRELGWAPGRAEETLIRLKALRTTKPA